MPDGEIFPGVPKRWLGAAHLLGGRAEPDEVAMSINKALARTLRKDGFPGLEPLAQVVEQRLSGQKSVVDAQADVASIASCLPMNQAARIALTTVERLLVREETQDAVDVSAQQLLTRRYCKDVIEVSLIGPAGPILLGDRFGGNYWAFTEYMKDLLESLDPSVGLFAESLIRDPSGATLRAPAGSVSRKTPTADLLYKPLE